MLPTDKRIEDMLKDGDQLFAGTVTSFIAAL